MNWDRENRRARQVAAETNLAPVDIRNAYKTLSFFLTERDADTRYVIAIPYEWETLSIERLITYFRAHKSGSCKVLRNLKEANWCRISRATAETVGMGECELCNPYSNS